MCVRLQSLCVMCEYDQSFDQTYKLASPRAQVLHLLLEEDLGIRDWTPEDYLELYAQYYRHRCNPSACPLEKIKVRHHCWKKVEPVLEKIWERGSLELQRFFPREPAIEVCGATGGVCARVRHVSASHPCTCVCLHSSVLACTRRYSPP